MTVSGTFDFWDLDGREPVTVVGATPCTDPGALFVWREPNLVYARENYKMDLVKREIQDLLTRGGIRPMVTHGDNEAVARAIEQSYRSVIQGHGLLRAEFTCGRSGDRYHYVVSGNHQRVDSGDLKTRCEQAHQNFVVSWRALDSEEEDDGKPVLLVQDFNAVSSAAIQTAFGEYLGDGVPQAKF